MTVVLRADCIGKSFGRTKVLSAATLRATAASITYLVGGNGCGKTTLLRIAAGALAADTGLVFFKSRPILRPRWHLLAREGFAYLPDRELLSLGRTVRYHLDTVVRQFGLPGYGWVVESCQAGSLLDRRCAGLSEGERRRAELAVTLVRRPVCLLADEPFRNLDPADREIIAVTLGRVAREGCAVVVTGHEVEDLMAGVDSVTWCTDGTTYELGTPWDALQHWRFVRNYVGPARTARLLGVLDRGRAEPRSSAEDDGAGRGGGT